MRRGARPLLGPNPRRDSRYVESRLQAEAEALRTAGGMTQDAPSPLGRLARFASGSATAGELHQVPGHDRRFDRLYDFPRWKHFLVKGAFSDLIACGHRNQSHGFDLGHCRTRNADPAVSSDPRQVGW